jgi:hypothetical protein
MGRDASTDPKYSADWWQVRDERADAIKADQQRVADYYENQQRARQEREEREDRERAMRGVAK